MTIKLINGHLTARDIKLIKLMFTSNLTAGENRWEGETKQQKLIITQDRLVYTAKILKWEKDWAKSSQRWWTSQFNIG